MSAEEIERYVSLAERLVWGVAVFVVALVSYIRKHWK
jgi:uncharacterized membrane protein YjfL (UPF0719 family)